MCLDSLALALDALLTGLLGPWEVCDWDDKEAVAGVGNTGKSVVPSGECGEESEVSSCLDERNGWVSSGVQHEVADHETEEGQVEEEEEQEERDGGAERAYEE